MAVIKNLLAIISFLAGSLCLILIILCFFSYLGLVAGAPGIILLAVGWPVSEVGFFAGLMSWKADFKKIGVIGTYLSGIEFFLFASIMVIAYFASFFSH